MLVNIQYLRVKNDFKNLANKSWQFGKVTLLKANANSNTNSRKL